MTPRPFISGLSVVISQRVAMKQGSAVTYLHGDNLGSTSVASNGTNGTMVSRQTYYAFGAPRTSEGTLPTDYTFTGQKLDVSDGLMYYNARYYDATIGRFIQPDSIIPDANLTHLSVLTVSFSNPKLLEALNQENRSTSQQPGQSGTNQTGPDSIEWYHEPLNRPGLTAKGLVDPQALNRYAYVRNNPIRYIDPSGYWTFGFGLGFNIGFLGGGASGSVMFVVDGYGNGGIALSGGGGGFAGVGGSGGLIFQGTNADNIDYLNGPVVQTGGSVDAGTSVGLEWVTQKGPDGSPIQGANLNIGGGYTIGDIVVPFEVHSMLEDTVISKPDPRPFDWGRFLDPEDYNWSLPE